MYGSRKGEGRTLGGREAEGGERVRLRAAPEAHAQAQWREYMCDGMHYAVLCAAGDLSAAPNLFH